MPKYYRSLDRLLQAAEFASLGKIERAAKALVHATEEEDFADMKDDVNEQQAEAQNEQQQQAPAQKQQQLSRAMRRVRASEEEDDMEDGDDPDASDVSETASLRLRRNMRARY